MRRRHWVIWVAVCYMVLKSVAAAAIPPSIGVTTEAHADSVTVGERIRIRFAATYPDSLTMLPVEKFDAGTCRILSLRWRTEQREATVTREADAVVITTDLEHAFLPPITLRFLSPGGDTLTAWTDPVEVPVRSMVGQATESRPLKPQWEAPRDWTFLVPIVIVLAALALALWLWRRRKRAVVVAPPAPRLPADYVAMESLRRIEASDALDRGEYKRYYSEIVDVIRRYLEERFAVAAMDRTTHEIVVDLAQLQVEIHDLDNLLEEADLVKFARFIPGLSDARQAVERARDIVAQTAPKARVAGE